MKKLLILLTLGLMFGQTEWTTRVYEYQANLYNPNDMQDITLSDITNGDLDDNQYANLRIVGIDDNAQISGTFYMYFVYFLDNIDYGYDEFAYIQHLGTDYSFYKTAYSETVLYEKNMNHKLRAGNGSFVGTLMIAVTGEFPIEDTGYMEEDFDFCINEGLNLVSYPCENDIAINDTLPSEISNNLSSIVGEGVAGVNVNGTWVGSLTQLQAGSGYWFKSSIEACFNYECKEN